MSYQFQPAGYLPRKLYEAITEARVERPGLALAEAAARKRRSRLTLDGRLVILATDHPGRRITALPGQPLGMADRHAYLARALRVLLTPGCDGIMGTPDFMEDLLILSALVREAGGWPLLDDKVLIGSMNRAGYAGQEGELDDRFTAFNAQRLKRLRFEGGKLMYRLDPTDARAAQALDDCARAITTLCREDLYAFLEPLSVKRRPEGGYETIKNPETLAKNAGAAAALGESSARTWLKLPYAPGYETVAAATTLPILMLGGEPRDKALCILDEFHDGMRAGANVRGVLVGRNVAFAAGHDPGAVMAAVAAIVHEGVSLAEATERLEAVQDKGWQTGIGE